MTSDKTKIQLLSRDVPLTASAQNVPVYTVPLQTTTTLNILLPLSAKDPAENSFKKCEDGKNEHQGFTLDMSKDSRVDQDEDSDDSESELDVANLSLNARKQVSSFSCISWDVPGQEETKQENSCIIVMKEQDIVIMFKASCQSEKTSQSSCLWTVMVDIAENFTRRLKKMKNISLPTIRAQHMDTLPLNDGRTTKDHLDELSKSLGDSVALTDVAYRFQAEGTYIGTFVQGTKTAKNYAIGQIGVIAVLSKKSKYATIEAFSEQLCKHIAINQPTSLGRISESDVRKINKRGTVKIVHLQKDQLLLQNFAFDPTIIVAEAARRSFVKIDDFLFFK